MSQLEVTEFIIVAPAGQGKAVQWAEQRLLSHLAGHFPAYQFRVEPFGPLADDDDFTVVPIMNRAPRPGERKDPDQIFMRNRPSPGVLAEIVWSLRAFDLTGEGLN